MIYKKIKMRSRYDVRYQIKIVSIRLYKLRELKRVMLLVILENDILNALNGYAHLGQMKDQTKDHTINEFYQNLDEITHSISTSEQHVPKGDINGCVRSFWRIQRCTRIFLIWRKNRGMIFNFATSYHLMIVNTFIKSKYK